MDNLYQEWVAFRYDSGEEHECTAVRDHVRHVDARLLRKIHKSRRGPFWKDQGVSVLEKGTREDS